MAQDGGSGNNNSKTPAVAQRPSVPRPTDASMGVSPAPAPSSGTQSPMTYPDGRPVDMNNSYDVQAATLAWANGGQQSSVPSNSDGRPVMVSHPTFQLPENSSADRLTENARRNSVNVTTVYAAREQLNAWRAARASGDPTYDNVVALLHSSGILGPRSTANSSIDQAWADALGQAAYNYAQRPTAGSDVFTYLKNLSASNDGPGSKGPGGGGRSGGGGGAAPITDSINLTDPGSAKLMLDQALSNYLGRKASEDEIAKFTGALTQKEMENPNHVAVAGQTQVQSGGFNPQAFADSWASKQKGVPEFQAATGLLDTFIGSLKNPTKVV